MDRAERRRRTANVVARRIVQIRWSEMADWVDEKYVGRCRHMSPFDCGRANCGVCRKGRRWNGATRQEQMAELCHWEYLDEHS